MIPAGLYEKGGGAVPLMGVEVSAEVLAGHSSVHVKQRYRNDEKKPIEAIYTFPNPTSAVLTGFSMTVNGRRLEGEVQEREAAFQHYADAISEGHGGALLEQERPNVFTANVGNLLPGEETVIEIAYVQPLTVDEGAVRFSLPTLVAPRYIPGTVQGDRTGHGSADPTTRVPDADRISPPIGDAPYGLAMDLVFDLGSALDVKSPSHAIVVTEKDGKTHVRFAQATVVLDRDIVVNAIAKNPASEAMPIATAVSHGKEQGFFAVTLVPDLGAQKNVSKNDVVFLLDRSGSMGGASMPEARTALKLCLRQLREGDRFNIIAFDDVMENFDVGLTPFTQATLQRADDWLDRIDARGGTELLEPMVQAGKLAPEGVVVLVTDGEVGNEDEILAAFLATRKTSRVYSFGIGTNVSDALLQHLAQHTGGAVEMIYPGERIDEKVVSQFARATARRVESVTIKARGVETSAMAPAEAAALVDGEPYAIFGRYETTGIGALEIRGTIDGAKFYLEVPLDVSTPADRPVVQKLWAQARIRDLEKATVTDPRRAAAMKDKIIALAKENGVSSKYTSFVVIEHRTGDRRTNAQPETRVVPVAPPAGWAIAAGSSGAYGHSGQNVRRSSVRLGAPAPRPAAGMPMPPPPARPMMVPAPMAVASLRSMGPMDGAPRGAGGAPPPGAGRAPPSAGYAPPAAKGRAAGATPPMGIRAAYADDADEVRTSVVRHEAKKSSGNPVLDILARQAASGLWEESGRDTITATAEALVQLWRLGVSTSDATYGAQIKKTIEALLEYVKSANVSKPALEVALGTAWLMATGARTKQALETAAAGSLPFHDPQALIARLSQVSL